MASILILALMYRTPPPYLRSAGEDRCSRQAVCTRPLDHESRTLPELLHAVHNKSRVLFAEPRIAGLCLRREDIGHMKVPIKRRHTLLDCPKATHAFRIWTQTGEQQKVGEWASDDVQETCRLTGDSQAASRTCKPARVPGASCREVSREGSGANLMLQAIRAFWTICLEDCRVKRSKPLAKVLAA